MSEYGFFIGCVFISALFWLLIALLGNVTSYVDLLQELLVFVKGWLVYPILAAAAMLKIVQTHSRQLIAWVLAGTLSSVALFLMPLLFWASGRIPAYPLAMLLSILMASLPLQHVYRRLNAEWSARWLM